MGSLQIQALSSVSGLVQGSGIHLRGQSIALYHLNSVWSPVVWWSKTYQPSGAAGASECHSRLEQCCRDLGGTCVCEVEDARGLVRNNVRNARLIEGAASALA